jgi:putative ABC transport system permease protein
MEGAFNDLSIKLQPNASRDKVIDALDRVLEPYGGLGAYGRDKQMSNRTIEGELLQLRSMSTVISAIFLAVAALLLNMVLSRLVHLQRPEIATLKAVGYSDLEVGLHFFKLVLIIGALGAGLGVALGAWLGDGLVDMYAGYFKFPDLRFRLSAGSTATAVGISFAAAFGGAFGAVKRVVSLPPAEAMRPAPPAKYRRSLVDLLGLARVIGPSLHMIIRELQRRPLRTIGSSFAIAASVGLMVVGGWYQDGLDALMYTQFHEVMREDLVVVFNRQRPARAVRDLGHLPGVLDAEGLRTVPVRFRFGHRTREGALWGYDEGSDMRTLRDRFGHRVPLPADGVVLTDVLAKLLEVKVGDTVTLEVREGARPNIDVTVSGVVDESFGLQGHMRGELLQRTLGEQPTVSMGLLRVDPQQQSNVEARLKDMPSVASVTRRNKILERFREQSGQMIWTMTIIITLFAATITVGVVYNNARIALSMRARDLASLRVLGFRRSEISAILLGEMAVQVFLALPIGLWFGRKLIDGIASTIDPETFRLPVIVTARSYAYAALVALAASALSALMVRRKIDRLDLIGVLKTRE